jgi:hypothetical protein
MKSLRSVLDRLLPALLMATSVTLLTAGLLSYAPSAFGDWRTPEPVLDGNPQPLPPVAGRPTPHPSGGANPSAGASPSLDPNATPTPVYLTSPSPFDPNATPDPNGRAFASRIRIPSLRIDLPVVSSDLYVPGNADSYPLCDVATFMREYMQPGELGTTYIYAHAQHGMFAPLLKASLTDDGASLIGSLIEVYTSNDELHLYEIYLVKRHATDLSLADAPPGVQMLVLQTSEGVSGTIPKLQVAARPISVVPASPIDANPVPHPRVCLPAST